LFFTRVHHLGGQQRDASAIVALVSARRSSRLRLLGAIAVAALAAYFTIGHAAHTSAAMDAGKALHGTGICLVLLALSAAVILPRLRRLRLRPAQRPTLFVAPALDWSPSPHQAVARASPVWLQRFLN
jgi:hypothetical protein